MPVLWFRDLLAAINANADDVTVTHACPCGAHLTITGPASSIQPGLTTFLDMHRSHRTATHPDTPIAYPYTPSRSLPGPGRQP